MYGWVEHILQLWENGVPPKVDTKKLDAKKLDAKDKDGTKDRQFSALRWTERTEEYVKSARALKPDAFKTVINLALWCAKATKHLSGADNASDEETDTTARRSKPDDELVNCESEPEDDSIEDADAWSN